MGSHVPRAGQGRVFTPTSPSQRRDRETARDGEAVNAPSSPRLERFCTGILFLLSRLCRAARGTCRFSCRPRGGRTRGAPRKINVAPVRRMPDPRRIYDDRAIPPARFNPVRSPYETILRSRRSRLTPGTACPFPRETLVNFRCGRR